MKIKIWGCRGSLPAPGPEKNFYGGNTSCIEIMHENTCIILDGGSGIQRLGESFPDHIKHVDILLTHLHLDHIMGLGFFTPVYNPEMTVNIWGPSSSNESLRNRLRRYFSPPIFPIRLKEFPCMGDIIEINDSEFTIGDFKITTEYICHPGPTIGYRLELGNKIVSYLPDHEPVLGSAHFPSIAEWTSGYNIAKEADLLFHDAQFKNSEYDNRIGWGHCSMNDAIDFGILAEAKKLVLFHHDPAHTDVQLDELFNDSMKNRNLKLQVEMARESNTYEF